ncbi:hypothetical protein NUACC21_67510 [Scytonema sp. NUACC21]
MARPKYTYMEKKSQRCALKTRVEVTAIESAPFKEAQKQTKQLSRTIVDKICGAIGQ